MTCRRLPGPLVGWECSISDEVFETYGLWPSLEEIRAEEIEYHREADMVHEEELAWAFVHGELDMDWPWYADEPCDIQHPQVFGPCVSPIRSIALSAVVRAALKSAHNAGSPRASAVVDATRPSGVTGAKEQVRLMLRAMSAARS